MKSLQLVVCLIIVFLLQTVAGWQFVEDMPMKPEHPTETSPSPSPTTPLETSYIPIANPTVSLPTESPQVIAAIIGGIATIIAAYLGYRATKR